MTKTKLISCEEIRKILDYNPETGVLNWKERHFSSFSAGNLGSEKVCSTWNKRYAGKEAGCINKIHGYRTIGLGKLIGAHRVAWAHFYGKWPVNYIDHINGNILDNRICNLRDVSMSENQRNRRIGNNNSSGVIGVSKAPKSNRWVAVITIYGQRKHIGTYDTIEEASAARKIEEVKRGFTDRHGCK